MLLPLLLMLPPPQAMLSPRLLLLLLPLPLPSPTLAAGARRRRQASSPALLLPRPIDGGRATPASMPGASCEANPVMGEAS